MVKLVFALADGLLGGIKPPGALKLVKSGKMVTPAGSLTDGVKLVKMVKPVGSLTEGLVGGIRLLGR